MKIAHSINIRVFCGEEENESDVIGGLKFLLPLDLEKEKIEITRQTAFGFSDRKIAIFEVTLTKNRHIKAFLGNLPSKISATDRQMLLRRNFLCCLCCSRSCYYCFRRNRKNC